MCLVSLRSPNKFLVFSVGVPYKKHSDIKVFFQRKHPDMFGYKETYL